MDTYMKKRILRVLALLMACLLSLLATVSCANKHGKPLLTLEKDGISVSISVNVYQFMMTRMKGSLAVYGYTANGVSATADAFWDYKDTFKGDNLQTIDEYYRDCILDNCKTYLVALYLFEKEGLSLSASAEEKIEEKLFELLRTDGNGSKTKLNTVLSAYGVNYDILKEIYTIEAKVQAVQEHLYGKNASKLGENVKDQFLNENYVHFRQIFLASYRYVYEKDANGDTIYYYTDAANKSHIYYDVHNGVKDERTGTAVKDKNGDDVYYVNDGQYKSIAYDAIHGEPAYVPTKDGKDYETQNLTAEELKKLEEEANGLYAELQGTNAATFEAVMEERSDDMATVGEYNDGYYLQKDLDYTASGEKFMYLDKIVTALADMEDGEIALISSNFGYHIIRKYPHSPKAYEAEENKTWFEDFSTNLITKLFLNECQSHYSDIALQDKVFATAPTMKAVKPNYYY